MSILSVETDPSGVTVLTLNDPDRRNPLSGTLIDELLRTLLALKTGQCARAVVLTGAGKAFCAGGDIRGFGETRPHEVNAGMRLTQRLIAELEEFPVPVIAAVNGAAAGAGFALAMACDVLIAAEGAKFVPAFGAIGAVPDLGLAFTLQRSIGLHRTLDVFLSGDPITAMSAKALGFVSEVVPDAEVQERAKERALQLASGPTVALGLTKQLVRAAQGKSLSEHLHLEASTQALVFATDDFREGVTAFGERRPARFSGC